MMSLKKWLKSIQQSVLQNGRRGRPPLRRRRSGVSRPAEYLEGRVMLATAGLEPVIFIPGFGGTGPTS